MEKGDRSDLRQDDISKNEGESVQDIGETSYDI